MTPAETHTLIGHAAAERAMLQAAQAGRVPHAWVIAGPPGVGKATLAFRFARFLLAHGLDPAEPALAGATTLETPADHPASRRVAAGSHGDLLYLSREGLADGDKVPRDLPVSAIRRIRPFLGMTAAEGGWRIAIVDEAETMTRSAANAILKVLEEPPRNCVLMLLSCNPGGLLPTIRSRCRLLRLSPVGEAALAPALIAARPGLAEERAVAYARLAQGCYGTALALHDDDALDLYRGMVEMLAAAVGNARDRDQTLIAWGEALAGRGGEFDLTFDLMQGLLERWVDALSRGLRPVSVVAEEADLLDPIMRRGGVDRLIAVWDKTRLLLDRAARANLDRRLTAVQVMTAFARS
ncbi:MAG: DNA polymerase III subunit delta' [Azospirillaceae bacterium]